ncbi:UNVERIFIED_CONTAM: hypothetical protein Sradi_0532900 [Sesamum radiatum]|uniref:DUF4283 domain-containing protein n=1 Tax=Sesamum radiatum TaxID=300843 RepID=A0AAW2VH05_SESRA
MEPDLQRLGKSLVLTEEEKSGVVMPSGVWHSDSEVRGFYLVGRILSHKAYNSKALKSILQSSFNPSKGMQISFIENGRFLLKFFHIIDRTRVLESGPWAFEKSLIVLVPVCDNENPQEVDLNWSEFYVRIHGLSIGRMTKEVAGFIGAKIGCLKEFDQQKGPESWGSFMRLRVAIDVTKPLPRWCETRFHESFVDPGEDSPYGPWLRAQTRSDFRSRLPQFSNNSSPGYDTRPRFSSRLAGMVSPSSPVRRGGAIFGEFLHSAGSSGITPQVNSPPVPPSISPEQNTLNLGLASLSPLHILSHASPPTKPPLAVQSPNSPTHKACYAHLTELVPPRHPPLKNHLSSSPGTLPNTIPLIKTPETPYPSTLTKLPGEPASVKILESQSPKSTQKRKYTKRTRPSPTNPPSPPTSFPSKRKLIDENDASAESPRHKKINRIDGVLNDISNLTVEAATQPCRSQ